MFQKTFQHLNNGDDESRPLTFTAVFSLESRFGAVANWLVVDDAADSSVQANVVGFANVAVDSLATDKQRLGTVHPQIGYPSFVGNLIFDG